MEDICSNNRTSAYLRCTLFKQNNYSVTQLVLERMESFDHTEYATTKNALVGLCLTVMKIFTFLQTLLTYSVLIIQMSCTDTLFSLLYQSLPCLHYHQSAHFNLAVFRLWFTSVDIFLSFPIPSSTIPLCYLNLKEGVIYSFLYTLSVLKLCFS